MQALKFMFNGLVVESFTGKISQTKYFLVDSKKSPIKSI